MIQTQPEETAQGGSAPIHVLAVIDCLEVGGAQFQLLSLAAGLPRTAFRFTVATSGHESLNATYVREGVSVRTLSHRSIKHRISPVFLARLTQLARHGSFDLIHGHLHSASVAAAVAARLSGLPLVLTHHSMNTWRPGWQRALGNWADRQADTVIAVATNIAATVSAPRVRVIRNGVQVPDEPWSSGEIGAARQALGVPGDAYVVSFVGRLSADKNPVRFVEVAARVAANCAQAHFLLIGDGPERDRASARAHELGVSERVTFAGFVLNAGQIHQAADVLVLTSDSEGSPLVVLDAMANRRPVVATAVGDIPLQVVDRQTGYVVPSDDVDGLASAVIELQDAALRTRLGNAGRERVLEKFNLESMFAETQTVYQEAVKRHRGLSGGPSGAIRPRHWASSPG